MGSCRLVVRLSSLFVRIVFETRQVFRGKQPRRTCLTSVLIAQAADEVPGGQISFRRHAAAFPPSAQDPAAQKKGVELEPNGFSLVQNDTDKTIVPESISHPNRQASAV